MNFLLEVVTIYKLPFHKSFGTAYFSIKNVPPKIHTISIKLNWFSIFRRQIKTSDIGLITCWSLYSVWNRKNNLFTFLIIIFPTLFLEHLTAKSKDVENLSTKRSLLNFWRAGSHGVACLVFKVGWNKLHLKYSYLGGEVSDSFWINISRGNNTSIGRWTMWSCAVQRKDRSLNKPT